MGLALLHRVGDKRGEGLERLLESLSHRRRDEVEPRGGHVVYGLQPRSRLFGYRAAPDEQHPMITLCLFSLFDAEGRHP